jgi:homoaconitase/3-isopropylmalate dehydratase large subunit
VKLPQEVEYAVDYTPSYFGDVSREEVRKVAEIAYRAGLEAAAVKADESAERYWRDEQDAIGQNAREAFRALKNVARALATRIRKLG